jgi:predicted ester cyclase
MRGDSIIEANLATVIRFFDGTHTGDLDVIDKTVSEAIVTHGFPGGSPAGREQYKQWFRTFGASFSHMAYERLATVADAAHVAVHWRVSVDHSGTFAGTPSTGKRVTFDGIALYRMEHGLIAETWLFGDEKSLLAQLSAPQALAA